MTFEISRFRSVPLGTIPYVIPFTVGVFFRIRRSPRVFGAYPESL